MDGGARWAAVLEVEKESDMTEQLSYTRMRQAFMSGTSSTFTTVSAVLPSAPRPLGYKQTGGLAGDVMKPSRVQCCPLFLSFWKPFQSIRLG